MNNPRQNQIDFHAREAADPAMPERQRTMHEEQLALHLGLQAVEKVIPFPEEGDV